MERSIHLAITLSFAVLTGACSSTATVVRRDPAGGQLTLQGPYVPAMEEARAQMFEHCQGRFRVDYGMHSRDVRYLCAASSRSELSAAERNARTQ